MKHSFKSLYKFLFPIVLLCFAFVLLMCFGPSKLWSAAQQNFNKWLVLTMILEKVERYYVDEPDTDVLLENAINGMLASLDPHSAFLPVDESQVFHSGFSYWGVGLYFFRSNDSLVVTRVVPNGPAAQNNVQVGDRLFSINGKQIADLSSKDIRNMISDSFRGYVTIGIAGKGKVNQEKSIKVQQLSEPTVPVHFLLDDKIAYIKITHFADTTPREAENALQAVMNSGADQILLDLRANPGGDLNAGILVADLFLNGGRMIAYTRGRTAQANKQFYATSKQYNMPLVVMINGQTASDGEIVAGALQDWDRAILAGEPTFGKALVQSEFPFQDGSTLLLTTARYYTPLGRMIQKRSEGSRQVYRTPQGRILKDGGCIQPDVLLASNAHKDELPEITGAVTDILFLSIEKYLNSIPVQEHPKDIEDFRTNFEISHYLLAIVQETAKANGVDLSNRQVFGSTILKKAIERKMAGYLWGHAGECQYSALTDSQIMQAATLFDKAAALIQE